MSEYAPGTVAMVTHNGRRKAIREGDDSWLVLGTSGLLICRSDKDVTDITPLVCLELTHDDADALDRSIGNTTLWDEATTATREVIKAIREQLPAPLEIPENLGAVVEDLEGFLSVCVEPGEFWAWRRVGPLPPKGDARRSTTFIRSVAVKLLSEGVPS